MSRIWSMSSLCGRLLKYKCGDIGNLTIYCMHNILIDCSFDLFLGEFSRHLSHNLIGLATYLTLHKRWLNVLRAFGFKIVFLPLMKLYYAQNLIIA